MGETCCWRGAGSAAGRSRVAACFPGSVTGADCAGPNPMCSTGCEPEGLVGSDVIGLNPEGKFGKTVCATIGADGSRPTWPTFDAPLLTPDSCPLTSPP